VTTSHESSLPALWETLKNGKYPIVHDDEGEGSSGKLHNAAYDAYLSGVVFIALMAKIGKVKTTSVVQLVRTSSIMRVVMSSSPD